VYGIGDKKSQKILEGLSEIEMFNKCVELLESEERVIENARLLWLRREPNQIWERPSEENEDVTYLKGTIVGSSMIFTRSSDDASTMSTS
jgi:hypothetical protein